MMRPVPHINSHKLPLTNRQIASLCKALAKNWPDIQNYQKRRYQKYYNQVDFLVEFLYH